MDIVVFLTRADNIGVLLRDPDSGTVAAIDAPDAAPMIAELEARGWGLDLVLVTHKHHDHVEGIPALRARFGCAVFAPEGARAAVPDAERFLKEGDRVMMGSAEAEVWHVPGHCADHIAYHFAADHALFVGDTLFTMGCGRIFDSTPEDLFRSLKRIGGLPADTAVYCGHEYTLSNARFAAHVAPENAAIAARLAAVEAARAAGRLTVPTRVGEERETNVFLMAPDVATLHALREAKNRF